MHILTGVCRHGFSLPREYTSSSHSRNLFTIILFLVVVLIVRTVSWCFNFRKIVPSLLLCIGVGPVEGPVLFAMLTGRFPGVTATLPFLLRRMPCTSQRCLPLTFRSDTLLFKTMELSVKLVFVLEREDAFSIS